MKNRIRHRGYGTVSTGDGPLVVAPDSATKKALGPRRTHSGRPAAATCLQWNSLRSSAGKTGQTRRRRDGLDIEMYSRLTVFREEQVESLANQPHADVLSIVTSEFRLENVELL